jgi:hypothetical protein
MSCKHCNHDPCHGIEFDEMLRGAFDAFPEDTPANVARRLLYSTYVRAVNGFLGRNVRVKVPSCVLGLVREISPDPAGEYMGHKDAPDRNDRLRHGSP